MTWQPVGSPAVVDNSTARHLAFPFALTTQAGTHIATYRVGTKHGVEQSGQVVASRSTDGTTWQTPVVLSNCEGDERSAKLAQAPGGTIYAAVWAWRTSDQSSIRSMLRTSTDDGASWSYPQPLNFPHTSWSAATGLVWHDGTLLAAAYGSDGGEQYVALSTGVVVASGGGNWQEPALVVNGDELLCFLRYEYGSLRRICLSRSLDGGATWSVPQTVVNGGGQPAPFIAPDGTWLLAYRDTASSAWLCRYAWSDDNGSTWQDGGNFSGSTRRYVYADWISLGDDLGLVYALESGDDAEVYLTRFTKPAPPAPTIDLTVTGEPSVGDVVAATITVNGVASPGEAVVQSITEGPPMSLGVIASAHVPFVTGVDYSTEVLADSPHVYFPMGESSGSTMVDSSANGYDGGYNGSPTLGASGPISGVTAVTFNGSSQSAGIDLDALGGPVSLASGFTAEAWVKVNGNPSGDFDTIASQWSRTSNKSSDSWLLYVTTSGTVSVGLRSTTDSYIGATSTGTVTDNAWHHVAFTYDGTTLRLYVDGSADGTNATSATIKTLTLTMYVAQRGHQYAERANVFLGSIGQFAFYESPLSAARIAAHYAAA